MKKNIKELILQTAIELFNEKGYRNVSLRDISSSLNISVSNIAYYFPKKAALVRELLKSNFDYLCSLLLDKKAESIHDLFNIFKTLTDLQENQKFYFKYMVDFTTEFESIREEQKYIRLCFHNYYKVSFSNLLKTGHFSARFTTKQYEYLAFLVVFIHTGWHQDGSITYDYICKEMDHLDFLLNTISLYLTDKGLEEYNQIMKMNKTPC